jgi:hypothetical protein
MRGRIGRKEAQAQGYKAHRVDLLGHRGGNLRALTRK